MDYGLLGTTNNCKNNIVQNNIHTKMHLITFICEGLFLTQLRQFNLNIINLY